MNKEIIRVARSDMTRNDKAEGVLNALKVTEEERDHLEGETREQASTFLWMRAREKRIRASICHRVITFTGKHRERLW